MNDRSARPRSGRLGDGRPMPRVAVALAAVMLTGCGRDAPDVQLEPVSGKVTYAGKPVPWGTVVFTPSGGRAASAVIQEDGSYRLTTYKQFDGAVVGPHEVSIVSTDQKPGEQPPPGDLAPLPRWRIPQRYGHPGESGLRFTVEAGKENVANFDLKE